MNKLTGNEPAYPIDSDDLRLLETGLTIRQHFAGLAMQGMCGNLSISRIDEAPSVPENIAQWAVAFADALIAELNKHQP